MNNQITNVVISSKNKKIQDTNSKMVIKFEEDLVKFVENDEELYVCMSSFHMIKSFYACQNLLNNEFELIIKSEDDEVIQTCLISEGNYNIKTLIQEIVEITKSVDNMFQISYDIRLNKFIYTNKFSPDFEVYIKPINSGIFLGLENGVEYLISQQGTYSSKFINLSGYTTMIIKIEGDVNLDNTISNINSDQFVYDKILGILNINDVAPMDSITYEDNNGCMFKHKVINRKIPSFKISIVNEDGNEFPQMGEWIMMLKFERVKNNNQMIKSENLLENMNYIMMRIFSYMEIPSTITLQDVINR